MKTSFRQFLSELNRKHDLQRRLISLICVLSLIVSGGVSLMLTLPGITLTTSLDPATNGGISEVVTDPSTHNAWMQYFGIGDGTYNTEFVGSVWTDKSVVRDYQNYLGQTIATAQGANMLGVLSAIGSSMAITGRIQTPTDTMLILDLSSSMYSGDTRSTGTVQKMVDAVNNSITTLLNLNPYNRIGVTIYWGNYSTATNNGSTFDHGKTLLPLDRYDVDTASQYLEVVKDGSLLKGIDAAAVKTSSKTTIKNEFRLKLNSADGYSGYVAGTYAQLGVQNARKEFVDKINAGDTTVTVGENTLKRQPIFIFMSDGRPTSSHSQFDTLKANGSEMAQWGLDSERWRTSDASDFVFQLTSAYSKYVVKEGYDVEPLFYTLGLGETAVSMNVMDPMGTTNKTDAEKSDKTRIDNWWAQLVAGQTVNFTVYGNSVNYGWPKDKNGNGTYYDEMEGLRISASVSRTTVTSGGQTKDFPYDTSQQNYVTGYFSATNADALDDAFTAIVNEIILKSIYTPTAVYSGRVNSSGEVSFVDEIGDYMEIKKIHGLMVGGQLHTGESFASIFKDQATALNALGDFQSATEFGMLFWNNLIEQLGIDHNFDTVGPGGETTGQVVPAILQAYTLIDNCWGKQLYWTSDTDWSNKITWYADANGNYLEYWDSKDTAHTPQDSRAAYRVTTYFFQNKVDGSQTQTYDTDLMYATVQVREALDSSGNPTGGETIVFSMPAALLPTLKYFVKLDQNGDLLSLHLGSVTEDTLFDNGKITTRPLRLIYEVGLEKGIDAQTVTDLVDSTYMNANKSTDGKVYFYSNKWERDGSYGTVEDHNTYSYFRPSIYNDRYYYVEDTTLWFKIGNTGNDSDYVPVTAASINQHYPNAGGKLQADMPIYTKHPLYKRIQEDDQTDKTDTSAYIIGGDYYMITGDAVITGSDIDVNADGQYYVKSGTAHTLDISGVTRFARDKTTNDTGTLQYRNAPTQQYSASDYVLAATLGNNGRIALEPKGQLLQKKLVNADGTPYVAETDLTFRFLLHAGDVLTQSDGVTPIDYSDGAAVQTALAGKKVTLIELTVKAGHSESGVKGLYDLQQYTWDGTDWIAKNTTDFPVWSCTYGEAYTVVELDDNKRFGFVSLGEINDATFATVNQLGGPVYQFTYGDYIDEDTDTDHVIKATNQFLPWQITLTKTNSDTNPTVLPGAIFGIYSPREADKLTALPTEYGQFTLSEIQTVQENHPATGQSTAWHLMGVATTDDAGQINWQNLTQEEYLIVELSPPPGYFAPTEEDARKFVQRSNAAEENGKLIYGTLSVTNTPGYEMPSTGGSGTSQYIYIGSAIMGISACLMAVYFTKRKEELA